MYFEVVPSNTLGPGSTPGDKPVGPDDSKHGPGSTEYWDFLSGAQGANSKDWIWPLSDSHFFFFTVWCMNYWESE